MDTWARVNVAISCESVSFLDKSCRKLQEWFCCCGCYSVRKDCIPHHHTFLIFYFPILRMPLANTGIIYIIFVSRGMYRNRNSYIPCLPDKELRELQTSLARCNPYVNQFKKYLEVAIETIDQLVEDDSNRKQHALPQSDVIGILVPGNIGHNNTHRNLFVQTKSSEAKTISDLHQCYDPFSNVLLHPSV